MDETSKAIQLLKMVLDGRQVIPVTLKILLDTIFQSMSSEQKLRQLERCGWDLESYDRSYKIVNLADQRAAPGISFEEQTTMLQEFAKYAPLSKLSNDLFALHLSQIQFINTSSLLHAVNPMFLAAYQQSLYHMAATATQPAIMTPQVVDFELPKLSPVSPDTTTPFSPRGNDRSDHNQPLLNAEVQPVIPRPAANPDLSITLAISDVLNEAHLSGHQERSNRKLADGAVKKASSKRRVKCDLCGKTYCDNGALKIHISAVHRGDKHMCLVPGCNKIFSSRRSRNRHSTNPNPKLHDPSDAGTHDISEDGDDSSILGGESPSLERVGSAELREKITKQREPLNLALKSPAPTVPLNQNFQLAKATSLTTNPVSAPKPEPVNNSVHEEQPLNLCVKETGHSELEKLCIITENLSNRESPKKPDVPLPENAQSDDDDDVADIPKLYEKCFEQIPSSAAAPNDTMASVASASSKNVEPEYLDDINPRICKVCKKEFQNRFTVKTHYKNVHLRVPQKCLVQGCNAVFPSKRSRDRHSRNVNLHRKLLSRDPAVEPRLIRSDAANPDSDDANVEALKANCATFPTRLVSPNVYMTNQSPVQFESNKIS